MRRLDRVRDQLWFSLRAWLREGGAIPEDARLAKELHAAEVGVDDRGRNKITSKKDMRKALGRSPDRADAVALATWELSSVRDRLTTARDEPPLDDAPVALNPYAGLEAWEQR